ncbi:uncharacterized protein LOC108595948 [Drosophila busckii]|nr:uncharacterized protein LOC108595948 [Drosophila busckii]
MQIKVQWALGLYIWLVICQLGSCVDDENCQKQNNITINELNAIPRDAIVQDLPERFKCYAKCMLQPILGQDGRISVELAAQTPPWDVQPLRMKQCKYKYEAINAQNCDYAIMVLGCLISK